MNIGKVIQKRRKELNITQEILAEKLHVSRSTVSNWETERNYPDIQMIVSISNVLDISLDDLLKGDAITVEKIASDTITRKKQTRKIKILYAVVIFIILLSVGLIYYIQKPQDILYSNQIKSIEQINDNVYITFNLPKYKSYEGYYGDYSDSIADRTMRITFFTKIDLSMKNNRQAVIELNKGIQEDYEDGYQNINKIQIVGTADNILAEIDLE